MINRLIKPLLTLSLAFSVVCLFSHTVYAQSVQATNAQHKKIYYEKGMYGGWPANNGIWSWGDEILVGFTKGFYKDLGPELHNMDRQKPELHLLARSLDAGETWRIEDPGKTGNMVPSGIFMAVRRTDLPPQASVPFTEPINFKHAGFALRGETNDTKAGLSRYWYSYDRGHKWTGPFELPNFGAKGTAARTEYIVESAKELSMFITVAKANGQEGRTIYIRTTDGGKSWSKVSDIGVEPKGYSVMPASARFSKKDLVVLVRNREQNKSWIEGYSSNDNGQTWTKNANPADDTGVGNPPALVKMKDGRLCLIYGYRAMEKDILAKTKTSDIRAKISNDNGKTWSVDYILRNDGSGQDVGYPRAVQRPDGKIVAVYYFMDKETGPERYIGVTTWEPPAKGKEVYNK